MRGAVSGIPGALETADATRGQPHAARAACCLGRWHAPCCPVRANIAVTCLQEVPMKSHPRPWLVSLILSLSVAVSASVTRAQEFPVRAPKIMVPFTPGGAADTFARLTGQKLGESWGKQVIIENRPGA